MEMVEGMLEEWVRVRVRVLRLVWRIRNLLLRRV